MILQLPVYQMTYGKGAEGEVGLVFTSEQEDNNQTVLFNIPIVEPHPLRFLDFFEEYSVVFPFLLGEEYHNLTGKVEFPEIIFNIPNTDIKIHFELEGFGFMYRRYMPFRGSQYGRSKYVGKHKELMVENNGFWNLIPVDLHEMNELYLNHRGVFVGLTPNFGQVDHMGIKLSQ